MIEKLTKRELEVLKLVSEGLINEEIADKLCISYHTMKAHLNAIYNKLDLSFITRKSSILRVRAVLIYLKENNNEKQKENKEYEN